MKTIVFTAILGDCDSLKPAPKGADRAVCLVTDPSSFTDPKGWELVAHAAENPRREAWHLRAVPHTLFDDYDRVVWIDASFTLTDLPRLLKDSSTHQISAIRHHARSNAYQEAAQLVKVGQSPKALIDPQIKAYQHKGFHPRHLSISCVIVRDRSDEVRRFNEIWANQITAWPGDNTQVSLDYSAWINGLEIHGLTGTRHSNPYATHDHNDHKRRRRPYDTEFGQNATLILHGSEVRA